MSNYDNAAQAAYQALWNGEGQESVVSAFLVVCPDADPAVIRLEVQRTAHQVALDKGTERLLDQAEADYRAASSYEAREDANLVSIRMRAQLSQAYWEMVRS